jgi:lysylphosphatidylglycerol synthetase-like protein (DUF2156 family)
MIDERTSLNEEREAHLSFLAHPVTVEPDAHLRDVHLPSAVDPDRQRSFLRIWAAASMPLLLLGIVVLLARPSPVTLSGFSTLLIVLAGVEAVARRRARLLMVAGVVVLAWVFAVAGLVLALLRNWQLALAGVLSVIAVILLGSNLREIRHRPADARPSATEHPSSS